MTDYGEKKYSMGIDLQTTKNHPYGKGAEHLSVEELVKKGREYRGGQSYKKVAAQLQQLANIQHNKKFEEAAERARKLGHEHGEYKSDKKYAYA